jgi:hypothetical protein
MYFETQSALPFIRGRSLRANRSNAAGSWCIQDCWVRDGMDTQFTTFLAERKRLDEARGCVPARFSNACRPCGACPVGSGNEGSQSVPSISGIGNSLWSTFTLFCTAQFLPRSWTRNIQPKSVSVMRSQSYHWLSVRGLAAPVQLRSDQHSSPADCAFLQPYNLAGFDSRGSQCPDPWFCTRHGNLTVPPIAPSHSFWSSPNPYALAP